MRNELLALLLFIAILPVNCKIPGGHKEEKTAGAKKPVYKDTFHKLCQYWEVTDAENPTIKDIYDHHVEDIYNFPGIIFMTDSTILENPRADMRYGTFILNDTIIHAKFDDGKKAGYSISSMNDSAMILRRVENNHTTILYLKGSGVFWPDASLNPFNKMNSRWRIKPLNSETPGELNERLKQCVLFYHYFFQGHAESESSEINFLGLPTCFKWYEGGIYIQGPSKLDKKWIDCFYSKEQALEARQMMEAVLLKKYDWDTTQKNWIKQTADVLKKIHDNM